MHFSCHALLVGIIAYQMAKATLNKNGKALIKKLKEIV
jgi:hypothetical protein